MQKGVSFEKYLKILKDNDLLYIPGKSHAETLQCIKSRSQAHLHYCHANTKIDEFENFSQDNKTT